MTLPLSDGLDCFALLSSLSMVRPWGFSHDLCVATWTCDPGREGTSFNRATMWGKPSASFHIMFFKHLLREQGVGFFFG